MGSSVTHPPTATRAGQIAGQTSRASRERSLRNLPASDAQGFFYAIQHAGLDHVLEHGDGLLLLHLP